MAAQVCWGRGSASRTALLLCLGCALWCWTASAAATLTVGGSQGWNTGVDYSTWAANQTFAKGDTLFFPYAANAHNVAVVNLTEYTACTSASNDKLYTAGNTSIILNTTGTSYYICTIPTHCSSGGMKLAVTVGASTPSSPTNGSAPSPKSSAVPSVIPTQLSYFAATFSALLAGFIL